MSHTEIVRNIKRHRAELWGRLYRRTLAANYSNINLKIHYFMVSVYAMV